MSSVALEFGIPIGNGILTCDTDAQAAARMDQKGFEAAQAALEIANLLAAIDELTDGHGTLNVRRRSRELVLQGLYQRQLSRQCRRATCAPIWPRARATCAPTSRISTSCGDGVSADYDALLAALAPHLDRKRRSCRRSSARFSSSARGSSKHRVEIPYRVVINEAVELAKSFGGTDGHRFVNGVLDKLAADLRAAEIAAAAARAAASS